MWVPATMLMKNTLGELREPLLHGEVAQASPAVANQAMLLQLAVRSVRLDLMPATIGLRGSCGNQAVRLLAGEQAAGRALGRRIESKALAGADASQSSSSGDDDSDDGDSDDGTDISGSKSKFIVGSSQRGDTSPGRAIGTSYGVALAAAAIADRERDSVAVPGSPSPSDGERVVEFGVGRGTSSPMGEETPAVPGYPDRASPGAAEGEAGGGLSPLASAAQTMQWEAVGRRMRAVPGRDSAARLAGRAMGGSGAVGLGVPLGLPLAQSERAGLGPLAACAALILPTGASDSPTVPAGGAPKAGTDETHPPLLRVGQGLQPWSKGGRAPKAGTDETHPPLLRVGQGLQPWSKGGRRNLIMAPTPGMACAAVQAGLTARGSHAERAGVARTMGVASERDLVTWLEAIMSSAAFWKVVHSKLPRGHTPPAEVSPPSTSVHPSDAAAGQGGAEALLSALQARVGLLRNRFGAAASGNRGDHGSRNHRRGLHRRGLLSAAIRRSVSRQVRLSVGSRRHRRGSLVGARVRVFQARDSQHKVGRVIDYHPSDGSHVVQFEARESGQRRRGSGGDGDMDDEEEEEEEDELCYYMHDRDYALVEEFGDTPVGRDALKGAESPISGSTDPSGKAKARERSSSGLSIDSEIARGVIVAPEPTGHALAGRTVVVEVGPRLFEAADVDQFDASTGKHRLVYHNSDKMRPTWVDLAGFSYRHTVCMPALALAAATEAGGVLQYGEHGAPAGPLAAERITVHSKLPIFSGRRIWIYDSYSSRMRLAVVSGITPDPPMPVSAGSGPEEITWVSAISAVATGLHCLLWKGPAASMYYLRNAFSRARSKSAVDTTDSLERYVYAACFALEALGSTQLVSELRRQQVRSGKSSDGGVEGEVPDLDGVIIAVQAVQGLSAHLSRVSYLADASIQLDRSAGNGTTQELRDIADGSKLPYIQVPGPTDTRAGALRGLLSGSVAFIAAEGGGSMLVPTQSVSACWAAEVSTGRKPRPGATGLVNLGNSCYMSAAVQGLSHCMPLAEYFVASHGPLRTAMPKSVDALALGGKAAGGLGAGDGAMLGRFSAAFQQFLAAAWTEFSANSLGGPVARRSTPEDPQLQRSPSGMGGFFGYDPLSPHEYAWYLAYPVIQADEESEFRAKRKKARYAGNFGDVAAPVRHYGFRSFAPSLLKGMLGERRPTFDSSSYQDGHEAFIELLDLLHEELAVEHEEHGPTANRVGEKANDATARRLVRQRSIIRDLFFVRTVTETRCLSCKHSERIHGPEDGELLPPLPIPNHPVGSMRWAGGVESALIYDENGVTGKDRAADEAMSFGQARRHRHRVQEMRRRGGDGKLRVGSHPDDPQDVAADVHRAPKDRKPWWLSRKYDKQPTVEDCLRSYFREAPLGSTFKCKACGTRGVVVGRPYLASLPPVLVVMLKRFEFVMTADGGAAMVKKYTPVLFDAGGGKPPSKRSDRGHGERHSEEKPGGDRTASDISSAGDGRTTAIVSLKEAQVDLALHMTSLVHPDFAESLHPGRPQQSAELAKYGSNDAGLLAARQSMKLRRPSFTGSIPGDVTSDRSLQSRRGSEGSATAEESYSADGSESDGCASDSAAPIGRAAAGGISLEVEADWARQRLLRVSGATGSASPRPASPAAPMLSPDYSSHIHSEASTSIVEALKSSGEEDVPLDSSLSGRRTSTTRVPAKAKRGRQGRRGVIESVRYGMFGLISHSGSLGGGHYTAYARPSHGASPLFGRGAAGSSLESMSDSEEYRSDPKNNLAGSRRSTSARTRARAAYVSGVAGGMGAKGPHESPRRSSGNPLLRAAVERSRLTAQQPSSGAGGSGYLAADSLDSSGEDRAHSPDADRRRGSGGSIPLLTPVLAPIPESGNLLGRMPPIAMSQGALQSGKQVDAAGDAGALESAGSAGGVLQPAGTREGDRSADGKSSDEPVVGGVNGKGPVVVLSGSDPLGDGLGADGTVRRSRAISLTPLSPMLPPSRTPGSSSGDGREESTQHSTSRGRRASDTSDSDSGGESPRSLEGVGSSEAGPGARSMPPLNLSRAVRSPLSGAPAPLRIRAAGRPVRASTATGDADGGPGPRQRPRSRAETADGAVYLSVAGAAPSSPRTAAHRPAVPTLQGGPNQYWVYFDDANSIPVEARRVSRPSTHKSAYMLLYCRETTPAVLRRKATERKVAAAPLGPVPSLLAPQGGRRASVQVSGPRGRAASEAIVLSSASDATVDPSARERGVKGTRTAGGSRPQHKPRRGKALQDEGGGASSAAAASMAAAKEHAAGGDKPFGTVNPMQLLGSAERPT